MRTKHPGRIPDAFIAIIALGCLVACSNGEPSGIRPDAGRAARSSPSPDLRTATAVEAALAAYAGYLTAIREAERSANPQHPELEKYLADPLLTRVGLAIRDAKEHGAMRTGTLISDPRVASVSLDTVPATVSIQDCLDTTNYQLVYIKDRSVVPGSASGRYVATATATRYADGRWLINAGTAHRDQPC
ncbi:hypothetical protein GCM10027280_61920 [Micromonospora polyrhachis]|uniref:Mce-associated membrane protein n=1 Tax=Micromonospora polyrhachis TaxID=1282883 RepID=A0A7W7SPQ5_9ACTN|nr:hypothetical protein [Micromonospora polyrhachis]MBB4958689.1 hypothetical protein [Micromonospora polyrhachis]